MRGRCALLLVALCAATARHAHAQRLPVRQYGVADGLAQNQIGAILQDRRGFLWFGTWEGLSRFDGRRFVNYGIDEGLPNPIVTSLAEDASGRLWVGTNRGLATLIDEPGQDAHGQRRLFRTHHLGPEKESEVIAVLFEADGRPWCLTYGGLLRGRGEREQAWTFENVLPFLSHADWTQAAVTDGQHRLWFGVLDTVVSVSEGRVRRHAPPAALKGADILGMLDRGPGTLLLAFDRDLVEFDKQRETWTFLDVDLRRSELTGPLARNSRGVLFAGTRGGLLRLEEGRSTLYTAEEGLAQDYVGALALDHDGDLWIGHGPKGSLRGLSRLMQNGIRAWTARDGVPGPSVMRVLVNSVTGAVYASGEDMGMFEMRDDGTIRTVPGSMVAPFRDAQRRVAQDGQGDWWVGTTQGLYRFDGPDLRLDRPGWRASRANGFVEPPLQAQELYAAPAGSIWASADDGSFYGTDSPSRQPPRFQRFTFDAREPDRHIRRFGMDRAGTLWVAGFEGVARLREGRVAELGPAGALRDLRVRSFLQDRRGRVWLGLRYGGLAMTEEPAATVPRWTVYSTRHGLASNAVWCLVEDAGGRIYAGTSRGLDRLDPATGRVRHFTAESGLPGDVVNDCALDRGGNIWLALEGGVARIQPSALPGAPRPPHVYLTGVAVAGAPVSVPERGTARLTGLRLPASRNSLVIDYVAPSLGEVSYQYKLEGADSEWSQPSPNSSVQYARLWPGRYRFLVRAVAADGVFSSEPALVEFVVEPPFWRRPWFLALAAALTLAGAAAAYQARVRRIMALQNVRAQIARDLHDDLGSGLGSIGILAGVSAERPLTPEEGRTLGRRIAETAGEMGDVLSDIVWTLRSDSGGLEALAAHLAERAARLFPAPPPELHTQFSTVWPRWELPLIVRRSLLLIALEALHNAARHAQATRVTLGLAADGPRLRLWVEDDGRGLPPEAPGALDTGMGLANMRRRAREAGADIAFLRPAAGGTRVEVALRPSRGARAGRGR